MSLWLFHDWQIVYCWQKHVLILNVVKYDHYISILIQLNSPIITSSLSLSSHTVLGLSVQPLTNTFRKMLVLKSSVESFAMRVCPRQPPHSVQTTQSRLTNTPQLGRQTDVHVHVFTLSLPQQLARTSLQTSWQLQGRKRVKSTMWPSPSKATPAEWPHHTWNRK